MSERERVTRDDLALAIEWLEEYEGEGEDLGSILRVAAFLRAEDERRATRAAVAAIRKETGASAELARKALNRARGRLDNPDAPSPSSAP